MPVLPPPPQSGIVMGHMRIPIISGRVVIFGGKLGCKNTLKIKKGGPFGIYHQRK
jgi:hypothetical protein